LTLLLPPTRSFPSSLRPRPHRSTLFPYTTLFRSRTSDLRDHSAAARRRPRPRSALSISLHPTRSGRNLRHLTGSCQSHHSGAAAPRAAALAFTHDRGDRLGGPRAAGGLQRRLSHAPPAAGAGDAFGSAAGVRSPARVAASGHVDTIAHAPAMTRASAPAETRMVDSLGGYHLDIMVARIFNSDGPYRLRRLRQPDAQLHAARLASAASAEQRQLGSRDNAASAAAALAGG